jgi:acetoin utilization deacetylase AcuC-like enzyme
MVTALIYSEKYLEHRPGSGHPERPERLMTIVEGLRRAGLWKSPSVRVVEPSPAERQDIECVHDPDYVSLVKNLSSMERPLDGDTPARRNTYELALLAAGGALKAGSLVVSGEVRNAFALVRPPGHHASRARGGGFCYFNNIAVMVERLRRDFGLRRVFILDFDAHCGNGTEDIFYGDPNVLYLSIHQHPLTLYPGTGFAHETGSGEGEGYTINIPVDPGSGDEEYAGVMQEIFMPLADEFKPELFAVSAGFDAHASDPLTDLNLTTQAYGWLTCLVLERAERWCGGRAVFVLEGGYNLEALSGGVVNVVRAMTGEKFHPPEKVRHSRVLDEVRLALAKRWSLR